MLSFCDPFPDITVTLPFRATPMVHFSRNFGKLVLSCAEADFFYGEYVQEKSFLKKVAELATLGSDTAKNEPSKVLLSCVAQSCDLQDLVNYFNNVYDIIQTPKS